MERISEKSREIEASADEVGKGWGRSMSGLFSQLHIIQKINLQFNIWRLFIIYNLISGDYFNFVCDLWEGRSTFMETIRERMFRPCLSAIVTDNPK